MQATQTFLGVRAPLATRACVRPAARGRMVVAAAAEEKLWFPGAAFPSYLKGLPGARGFDPIGLGADPKALNWHRHAELIHCRWAMLGAAGVLLQTILYPDQWWYESGLPKNLPDLPIGGGKLNLGGVLAWEFLLMHFVELRRWQDIKNHGSVNDDPVFKANKIANPEPGYPGFDPLGLSKGNFKELQEKEIKNGRLAMIAFMGFVLQAQATGKNPITNLTDHLANPFGSNIGANIGVCHVPPVVDVDGLKIPLYCLWPGQQL